MRKWELIKSDFFESDFKTLEKYLAHKFGKVTEYHRKKSKGWVKQRKSFLENRIKSLSEDIDPVLEDKRFKIVSNMKKGKMMGINSLIEDLIDKNKRMSVKDRIEILKFIKTELGETGEIKEVRNIDGSNLSENPDITKLLSDNGLI